MKNGKSTETALSKKHFIRQAQGAGCGISIPELVEGIFKSGQYDEGEHPYCFVVRYDPGGCCGIDAMSALK